MIYYVITTIPNTENIEKNYTKCFYNDSVLENIIYSVIERI